MSDERDLPTIKQILEKADHIREEPLSDDESRAWFEWTVRENRERRERK